MADADSAQPGVAPLPPPLAAGAARTWATANAPKRDFGHLGGLGSVPIRYLPRTFVVHARLLAAARDGLLEQQDHGQDGDVV